MIMDGEPQSSIFVRIEDVVIGDRIRDDLGDLGDLVLSIKEFGVLSPVTLLPGNRLLAGLRRIEAAKQAGLTEVPFLMADYQDDAISILKAERDENTCRKPMTTSEIVKVGRKLEELERPNADQRRKEGNARGGGDHRSENSQNGRAADAAKPVQKPRTDTKTNAKVADALGISEDLYMRTKWLAKVADGKTDDSDVVRLVATRAVSEIDRGRLSVNGAKGRVILARRDPGRFDSVTGDPVSPRIAPSKEPLAQIASRLGISESACRNAGPLIAVADGRSDDSDLVRTVARAALAKLDSGELGESAAKARVYRARDNPNLFDPVTGDLRALDDPARPRRSRPVRGADQEMIERALASVSGAAMALNSIDDLDPAITAGEAARLVDDLTQSLNTLQWVRRLLNQRKKDTP